jgi:hypothetical protein
MVPFLQVFSLVWLSVGDCCCVAGQWQRGCLGRRSGRGLGYGKVNRCGAGGIRRGCGFLGQNAVGVASSRRNPPITHGKEAAAGSHRYKESQPRRARAAMKQRECMLREGRNGRSEKTVAVWGCVAVWQDSPRNLSISRPPPDRQVAVWGAACNARRNGRVDAANRKACKPEPVAAGVSEGSGRQVMRMWTQCENAARVECLAENTGLFEVFQQKRVARVECLAEKTRDFEIFEEEGTARVECLAEATGVFGMLTEYRGWHGCPNPVPQCSHRLRYSPNEQLHIPVLG